MKQKITISITGSRCGDASYSVEMEAEEITALKLTLMKYERRKK